MKSVGGGERERAREGRGGKSKRREYRLTCFLIFSLKSSARPLKTS